MSRKRTSTAQKLLLVTLGLALPLILVEGVLQVAAWRASRVHSSGTSKDSSATRVLCVGDSFTFGIGASESGLGYPAQLRKLLQERSPDGFEVVEEGLPGRNSNELVEILPRLLAAHHPDVTCVLIGINNRWAGSAPPPERSLERALAVVADAGGGPIERFRWRFRTARLLRVLTAHWWVEQGSVANAAAPPIAAEPMRPPRKPDPPFSSPPTDEQGRARTQTLRELQRRVAEDPEGTRPQVLALDTAEYLASDSPFHAAVLLEIYTALREFAAAVRFGNLAIERYGEHPDLCAFLVRPLRTQSGPQRARRFARIAATAYPQSPLALSVHAVMQSGVDPTAACELALRALLAGSVAVDVRAIALEAPTRFGAEFESRLRAIAPVDEEREWLRRQLVLDDPAEATVDLVPDLEFVLALLQDCAVRPVILLYPGAVCAETNRTIRAVCTAHGISPVDVERRFQELLQDHTEKELFCADRAHPNDFGYGILAEMVAETVQSD